MISAVLFGALAGTGVLPFSRAQFEATIERGGVGVAPSLKAFARGACRASTAAATRGDAAEPGAATPAHGAASQHAAAHALDGHRRAAVRSAAGRAATGAIDPRVRALLERIDAASRRSARVLREGVRRLIDYQDPDYAGLYLDRMARIARAAGRRRRAAARRDRAPPRALDVLRGHGPRRRAEDARHALRARARRGARRHATRCSRSTSTCTRALQEICRDAARRVGRWLERPGWPRRLVERFTRKGRVVTTSSLRGFLMLRTRRRR